MEINKDTKLMEILKEYPYLADVAKEMDPRFAVIDSPLGKMLAKKYSIADVAKMGNISVEEIINEINYHIQQHENPSTEEIKEETKED